MVRQAFDLWTLVRGQPELDPNDLAAAVALQAREPNLDYRTRLLIRDSVEALKDYWGSSRAEHWLSNCDEFRKIYAIGKEEFDKVGFPSIRKRLMDKTDPDLIAQYFRELSRAVHKTLRMPIGDSVALIVPGFLDCHTDDIDVVDEVPKEFRERPEFLDELQTRYGLLLAHFQQHYLPSGWSNRLRYHDSFGDLHVYFVDPIDIFLGKLTSGRTKDPGDLRVLKPQLDKAIILQRLRDTMQTTLASEILKERAKKNWYILYGDELPS